jgi:hypothetical protein
MAIHLFTLILGVFGCLVASAAICTDNLVRPPNTNGLKVADGFRASIFTSDVLKPRSMVFDKDNNLLVVESGVGIAAFKLSDDGGTCVKPVGQKKYARKDTQVR